MKLQKSLKAIILVGYLIFTTPAQALEIDQAIDKFKDLLRPHLVKIIGNQNTAKLLGSKIHKISMPKIPKLKKDAKNTDVYKRKEKNNSFKKLSSDEKEKLNFVFVQDVFEATRLSKPDDNEIKKWLNILNQGGSREGMYRALVLDNFYASLENLQDPPSDNLIKFSLDYMDRYLDRKVSKEIIEQHNFYSIKSLVTEKTLEVIDALSKDPASLSDWYALFSADLAGRFQNLWKGKLRKETDAYKHKAWAESVPLEHIKSEVIIKLHRAFNQFK